MILKKPYCTSKWLRLDQVRHIPRPTVFKLSAQEILDPLAHCPIIDKPFIRALAQLQAWYVMDAWKGYCTRKWLHPNHVQCIPRPTVSALSAQKAGTSAHYPILDQPFIWALAQLKVGYVIYNSTSKLLYPNDVLLQDPWSMSHPHIKYPYPILCVVCRP